MTANRTHAEVRQHFNATPQKIFTAFAEERWVSHWLSPSPDITLKVLQFDFRVGGAYRFAYHLPEGKAVTINGVYREIEPPSKIVFSWIIEPPDEHAGILSEVTVTITPYGDGVELLICHEKLMRTDAIERHAQGWHGALEQLTALLETERKLK